MLTITGHGPDGGKTEFGERKQSGYTGKLLSKFRKEDRKMETNNNR